MKIKIVPDAFGDGESTLEKKESPSFLEYGLPALCQLGATYFGNLSLQCGEKSYLNYLNKSFTDTLTCLRRYWPRRSSLYLLCSWVLSAEARSPFISYVPILIPYQVSGIITCVTLAWL